MKRILNSIILLALPFIGIGQEGTFNTTVGYEVTGGQGIYVVERDSNCFVISDDPIGIDEIEKHKNALTLYPNPVSAELYVETPQDFRYSIGSINIYNRFGQKLDFKTDWQHEKAKLNVFHLPKGIYILEWPLDKKVYTGSFIKH